MESLIRQRSRTRERRIPPQRTESIEGDSKLQKWLQSQFFSPISQDYDSSEDEYATAIAAAAFAIFSIEEASLQHQKKIIADLETSRTKIKSEKEDWLPASSRVTRQLSSKGAKNTGEASMRKTMGPVHKGLEKSDKVETKADAWEKTAIEKIRKRYEKLKSTILAWENEKKMKTKHRLERKQAELKLRREKNLQHYQIKIARIDQTATAARAQAEENRRNEESKVKDKAKKIRSTGKVPVSCSCF